MRPTGLPPGLSHSHFSYCAVSRSGPSVTTLLKVLLAVGIVVYLVYLIEPDRLWETARTAEAHWIVAAALLLPVNLALEGVVWRVLVRRVVPDVPLRSAFSSLLCGYAFGIVTPGRIGELAGRAFYLHYPDKWELGTVVFAQRLVDMVMAALGGSLAVLAYITMNNPDPAAVWWGFFAFGMGTAVTLAAALLLPTYTHRLLHRVLPERAARRAAFLQKLAPSDRASFMLLSAVRYLVYTSQFVVLLLAFAPATALGTLYVGVALTFLAKFIIPPVAFLDIGIRESAAVFFLGQLGVAQAAAFNASFLVFGFNILLPALLGVPFVLRMRVRERAGASSS